MKLIIGLGNPETRYDGTRHNVGFFVLDALAKEQGISFVQKPKFKALIAETSIDGEKILLVKPTTYYNLVGQSVQLIAAFYKVDPQDILIVHDDLALPLGTLRTRIGGSHAGNNGIKSLNQDVDESTARLRIGTYVETPADQVDFVLGTFTSGEQKIISNQLPKIADVIASFARDSFEPSTHRD